ncbi:multicopper oxidase family protein [Nocardiopsis tropica]|nr:multicopper oxidase domain-containing protein [Nocardiopsis umidischolae]
MTMADLPKQLGLTPFKDALPVPAEADLSETGPDGVAQVTVRLKRTKVSLHSELDVQGKPATEVFAYDGTVPGPTFDVARGTRIRVIWENAITAGETYPVRHVWVPPRPPGTPSRPGSEGAATATAVEAIRPWSVTHQHGGYTDGGSDGWTDDAVYTGRAQLSEYANDQPGTLLWYHDHAMGITRWNVFAGLFGAYILRDEDDEALTPTSGADGGTVHEVPLILGDRNLETTDGRPGSPPTAQLLHKVVALADGPATGTGSDGVDPDDPTTWPSALPFTGPYQTVNGRIWPYLEVERRWYRFRVLNGANARTYTLRLFKEDGSGNLTAPAPEEVRGAVLQVGTDSGRLGRPIDLQGRLTISPAERADLLVDFKKFGTEAGKASRLRLVMVDGEGDPTRGELFPAVMQFRVSATGVTDSFTLPANPALKAGYVRVRHDDHPDHGHRMVLITQPDAFAHPKFLELEHVAEPGDHSPHMSGAHTAHADDGHAAHPAGDHIRIRDHSGRLRTYRKAASTFMDTINFVVPLDGWEMWSFLNLGGPMHPMHIHLTRFQALRRDTYDVSGFDRVSETTRHPLAFAGAGVVNPDEEGWKDVIRVGPGTMVSVMGRFTGGTGRYMYHCHLLEHEDMGMMRPFNVAPPEIARFGHTMGHGAAATAVRIARDAAGPEELLREGLLLAAGRELGVSGRDPRLVAGAEPQAPGTGAEESEGERE